MSEPIAELLAVTPHDLAHGGESVARVDGKTVFVAGVMPGEQATVRIVKDKGSWARAELVEITVPSVDRIEPQCQHFGVCGGCQWQFSPVETQTTWKRGVVQSQLAHLAGLADVVVRETETPGPAFGYRNRMDFKISGGRPALYIRAVPGLRFRSSSVTCWFPRLPSCTSVSETSMASTRSRSEPGSTPTNSWPS